MTTFYEMTNDEVHRMIQNIVKQCHDEAEVNSRCEKEFGYPYHIAVSYSDPNPHGQRMSMFMAHGHDGVTLR